MKRESSKAKALLATLLLLCHKYLFCGYLQVLDLINFPSQHPEMSYFQYHVDPVIEKWDDDDSVIKNYIENDYLELKVKTLPVHTQTLVTVVL